MKTKTFRSFPFILLLLALCFARPVLAHGDEPRLEISVEKINPGGVVELRGVDFEVEESVSLALIGNGSEIQLGDISPDTEGGFLQLITLPVDLSEGAYQFRAVTADHEILSPSILVQGPPITNEEAEGQREEEDPLLAPMPTSAPGAAPTFPPPSDPAKPAPNQNQNLISLSVAAAAGIFIVFGLSRLMNKNR